MSRGKRYTREEWNAIIALKNLGMRHKDIAKSIGREETQSIMHSLRKYDYDYDKYIKAVSQPHQTRQGRRKVEQLQFIPPEMPKAPKKISVRKIDEDEFISMKLQMATRQAQIVKKFVEELRDAGFNF